MEGLRSLEAGWRQKPELPRGTGPGTGRHGEGARWVPRPDEAGLPQPEALTLRLWGSLDLPPCSRPPPAGPRRRLPYLRSPGPPFYFLKPSHKALRPAPGLGLLSAGRLPAPAHSTRRRQGEKEGSSHQLALQSRACALTVLRPPPLPARGGRGVASTARLRTGGASSLVVLRSQLWQDAKEWVA